MLRLAADENFNGDIVRALLRRKPDLDIARVQDAGLSGADDPAVLEWAANEGRTVVTHDVSTLAGYAFERAAVGKSMPGVFAVSAEGPVGSAIDDLLLLAECSIEGEWEGQVRFCRYECYDWKPTSPSREWIVAVRSASVGRCPSKGDAVHRHRSAWACAGV
jgi:hypothetical protein